jgi:peptide/nickel transport system substrate-binding protein
MHAMTRFQSSFEAIVDNQLSRRELLKALATGASTLLVAACGSSIQPVANTPPAVTAPAAANTPAAATSAAKPATVKPANQPKPGGILRAAIVGELTSIDGQQNLPGITATVGNAYESLTRYDDKLQPQPLLAESWDVTSDGTQIKLNLRKGVQFHDGREFTSDDVKYSLLRLRDPKIAPIVGPAAIQSGWWTTVDTPDKSTIILKSEVARPGVFDFLQYFTIVDKNLMEGPDAKTKVNGTGPFSFVEWVPGDHVSMAKNKNYWRSSVPYLDGVTTRIFRDAQAMVATLEAGAVDQIDSPNLLDVVRLKADPNYQALVVAASGQFVCMVANTTVAPTDNKQFRQAVNYAVDRKRFVDTAFKGIITDSQDLPYPPQVPAFDATRNKVYSFDLDKARSLIATSGVRSPEIELVYSNTTFGDLNQTLAQILQADLSSVGVKVTLRPVDFPTQFDVATRRAYNGLLLSAGSAAQLAEATSLLTRSRFYSPDPKTSFTGLDNPKYRELISTASTEPDASKRKALYGEIEDIILDESATMAISLYPQTGIASSKVHGLTYDIRPALTYADTWLE